jgi:hypothetical protein
MTVVRLWNLFLGRHYGVNINTIMKLSAVNEGADAFTFCDQFLIEIKIDILSQRWFPHNREM